MISGTMPTRLRRVPVHRTRRRHRSKRSVVLRNAQTYGKGGFSDNGFADTGNYAIRPLHRPELLG